MSKSRKENSLEVLLTGNDERISLTKGFTKHFINPSEVSDSINRGNCTCSGLSSDSEAVIEAYSTALAENGFEQNWESIRAQLASLFDEDCDVFIAPSGSHLTYFPLLYHSIVNPSKKIVSIVSCSNELGSGTERAYQGDVFFEMNQFGDEVSEGIENSLNVQSFHLDARDEKGGVVDNTLEIERLILKYQAEKVLIVNLSAGSKSGLVDDFSLIEKYPKVTWVVDSCQYRMSQQKLNSLLKKGALIFITGSKFYEAPPYCGAMVVQKQFGEEINANVEKKSYAFFKQIFSLYDFPPHLTELRSSFPVFENVSVLYKWGIALENINKLKTYSDLVISQVIEEWNKKLKEHIVQYSNFIKILPAPKNSIQSILSFTLHTSCQLAFEELNQLRALLAKDNCYQLNEKNILIGQPVKYGDQSFIRLALGVNGVCDLLNGKQVIDAERAIIDLIVSILKSNF